MKNKTLMNVLGLRKEMSTIFSSKCKTCSTNLKINNYGKTLEILKVYSSNKMYC